MLVISIIERCVACAGFVALWRDLRHIGAVLEGCRSHMVCALRHGLRLAGAVVTEISTSDDSSILEPRPRSADLSAVASLREAVEESATSGSVCS